MNSNKLKIVILLAVFALLCTIGTLLIYRNYTEILPEETSAPTTNTTAEPTTQMTTLPVEITEETTEPTTVPTTEATTVPETTEAILSEIGLKAAQIAKAQVGKSYLYGTAGPDTFDTSGLVQYCYKECGVQIPRSNSALASYGYVVDKEDIQPGDAVFFWSKNPGVAEYLGVYVGDGIVVAALNPSQPVIELNMNSSYYTEHFVFARRFY